MRRLLPLASLVATTVAVADTLAAQAAAATSCPPALALTAADRAPSLAPFAYDRAAPLELRDSVEHRERGATLHRISFASPKGGRATGFLMVPDDSLRGADGRFAGMVLLHGAPGDATNMLVPALALARQGALSLLLDAPFARRDPGSPLSFTPRDSVDQVQLMIDLQRAVDVLAARPDVDTARIAFMGASYGGAMGAQFAGIEPRLKAVVLHVADAGLAAHFTNPDGSRVAPVGPFAMEQWCGWFAAMEPLASDRFIGRQSTVPILFQWGKKDEAVKPYLARALYAAAARPKEERWYDSGHGLPPQAHWDMLDWLVPRLGLRPVPAYGRSALPTVSPVRPNAGR